MKIKPETLDKAPWMWGTAQLGAILCDNAELVGTKYHQMAYEEAARRLNLFSTNPRWVEQDTLRAFVRVAEMLDDYYMGGSRPPAFTLEDIRNAGNDAANAARELLSITGDAKRTNPTPAKE